ncbi:hypothetical protein EKO04_009099 [Ascochyta lentis]|uniref:Uncharacterized protein n=1 Tax=Ascochyta lentis TaxID=205686 RepID=A0A8H7ME80_9PLEO|nr:hypothetical protein EKO04_009099 [Ascochyta lentis]
MFYKSTFKLVEMFCYRNDDIAPSISILVTEIKTKNLYHEKTASALSTLATSSFTSTLTATLATNLSGSITRTRTTNYTANLSRHITRALANSLATTFTSTLASGFTSTLASTLANTLANTRFANFVHPDDDIGWNRIHSIHSTQSGANTAAENLTKKYLREEPGSNVEEERTDEDGNYYGYVKLYEDSFLFHKEAHVIVTVSKWFVDEVEETKNKPAEKAGTKHVKDGSKKRKR